MKSIVLARQRKKRRSHLSAVDLDRVRISLAACDACIYERRDRAQG